MKEKVSCGSCAFFDCEFSRGRDVEGDTKEHAVVYGECKRSPPVFHPALSVERLKARQREVLTNWMNGHFPHVDSGNWCGEFVICDDPTSREQELQAIVDSVPESEWIDEFGE